MRGVLAFLNVLKINSKKIISISFAFVSALALFLSIVAGGVKLAYNVKFGDKVITTVSDKKVYYAAVDLLSDVVNGDNVEDVLPEVKIDTVVTVENAVNDCETVVDAIIENTDEIVSASYLYINGEKVGCADTDDLSVALENRKSAYDLETDEYTNEFCDDVKLEEGYFLKSEIGDISSLSEIISGLSVQTTARVSYEQSVQYKTVTNKDSSQPSGYVNIEKNGVNGINRVTSYIIYINGVETERLSEETEVVSEPVDEIVTVGTAKKTVSVSGKSGFAFPLPKGSWEISCPYGKNGHKGVDLRAPIGTSIFAAVSGKVTLAGRYMDYGNCVIIDHGNGISTLYAHASRLCVSEGDYVSAGDVIALVGSTGNSTGNHLHFEVYIGSDRVNPQPYIGL